MTTLADQLRAEEGERASAYQDSLGYWTIGVGRLIDARKGGRLRPNEIDVMLTNDIEEKTGEVLAAFPWAAGLDSVRQAVLIGMAFQMGVHGLASFTSMLKAAQAGDWTKAADQMMTSLWAKQTPHRAQRLHDQLITNEWQLPPGTR